MDEANAIAKPPTNNNAGAHAIAKTSALNLDETNVIAQTSALNLDETNVISNPPQAGRITHLLWRVTAGLTSKTHCSTLPPRRSRAPNASAHIARAALSLLTLFLTACSLAGDVTPPPTSRVPTPAAVEPTLGPIIEPLLPEARPVALDGGAIFQERCAACHGPTGNGGGSMTAQLPSGVPDFSTPGLLRQRTPQDLFLVVTQGRLDKFMPPFAGSLSVAERWNAVAYLHSLGAGADYAAGEAAYIANCASCHGPQGQGDGLAAADFAGLRDLSDHEYAAIRSSQDYFDVLNGDDPAHAFAGALSEVERWAAVDYARTLAYDYAPPEAVLAERQGTVQGRLVNGTAGAAPPSGLAVVLYGFENDTLLTTVTATVQADGAFAFSGVAFRPGRQFVATTEYQGIAYSSDPARFRAGAGAPLLDLPMPVYETTTDTRVLSVAQVHLFLEFVEPRTVTVGELFVFSNSSDQTLSATAEQPLEFSLPSGATALNVQGGRLDETYFVTDRGFAVAWSVAPGAETSQILYSYRLPYNGELSFAQPVDYPLANVNVLVSDLGVKVVGPRIEDLGLQEFQGQTFQNFAQGALAPGETLSFAVSGEPGTAAAAPGATTVSDPRSLAIGLGALALVLLGIGVWTLRRRSSAAAPATQAGLLRALADLDDAYAARAVGAEAYHRQRVEMKEALKSLWGQE